jgi:hypothetical protein
LVLNISPSDTNFHFIANWQYKNQPYGALESDTSAENVALLFMLLDRNVFGYNEFRIIDTSLFVSYNILQGPGGGIIRFPNNTGSLGKSTAINLVYTVCIATSYYCSNPSSSCCAGGCDWRNCCSTVSPCYPIYTCTDYEVEDDPFPPDPPPPTGGGDNGGGGSGGGGWIPPSDCPGTPEAKLSTLPGCDPGWTPNGNGQPIPISGYRHFENWTISQEDVIKLETWRQNNIDTTGIDSCLRKILDKLIGGNNLIGRILAKMEKSNAFPNNIEKFKIVIRVDSLPHGENGATLPGHFNETTKVFTDTIIVDDSLVNFGTEIGVARTVIHELIHAYLKSIFFRYFHSNHTSADIKRMKYDSLFSIYTDTLIARHSRLDLNNWLTNNPEYDHNFMADRALERMKEALAVLDNNRNTDEYYWMLTWGGLWKSQTWASYWPTYPAWPPTNAAPTNDSTRGLKYALTQARIDTILRQLNSELYGRPDAKGRPKIPGGCY